MTRTCFGLAITTFFTCGRDDGRNGRGSCRSPRSPRRRPATALAAKAASRSRRMSTRPSRLSLPSSHATASAKARWISSPMMRMPAPPSWLGQNGSWRATRHLLIRARSASGKVARGGHVTSSGSQPTVFRRPARTFVLPVPRVPDGLTIRPFPRRTAGRKAPQITYRITARSSG